jgi:hypothetical protein
MLQPYVVIFRVAHERDNKDTVVFRIEVSMLYTSFCVNIYMSSCIVLGKKVAKVAMYTFF